MPLILGDIIKFCNEVEWIPSLRPSDLLRKSTTATTKQTRTLNKNDSAHVFGMQSEGILHCVERIHDGILSPQAISVDLNFTYKTWFQI